MPFRIYQKTDDGSGFRIGGTTFDSCGESEIAAANIKEAEAEFHQIASELRKLDSDWKYTDFVLTDDDRTKILAEDNI